MPELRIPDLTQGDCNRLLVSGYVPLTSQEHRVLLDTVGTDDQSIHTWTRRSKKVSGLRVVLEERFGIDPLTSKASRASAKAFFESEKKEVAAALHVDVDVLVATTDTRRQDRPDDRDRVIRFWEWVSLRGGLKLEVHAWSAYSTEDHEPIIQLPLPVPTDVGAFSGISGLLLVKSDTDAPDQTLYEVLLKSPEKTRLTAMVTFRTRVDGAESVLEATLAQAMQIMEFAVHPRDRKGAGKE